VTVFGGERRSDRDCRNGHRAAAKICRPGSTAGAGFRRQRKQHRAGWGRRAYRATRRCLRKSPGEVSDVAPLLLVHRGGRRSMAASECQQGRRDDDIRSLGKAIVSAWRSSAISRIVGCEHVKDVVGDGCVHADSAAQPSIRWLSLDHGAARAGAYGGSLTADDGSPRKPDDRVARHRCLGSRSDALGRRGSSHLGV
jgi:hypothetical protein